MGYVILGLAAVIVFVFVASYNRFVRAYQAVGNSWSNVETELQRRYDLIPNLVATVKGYAAHERETLEAVIAARNLAENAHGDPASQAPPEQHLVAGLRHLMALSEAYPKLQADLAFLDLQDQLVYSEDRIQATRRLFNGNVRAFNTRIESIPSNIVGKLSGFKKLQYFEIDAVIRSSGAPMVALDGDLDHETVDDPDHHALAETELDSASPGDSA